MKVPSDLSSDFLRSFYEFIRNNRSPLATSFMGAEIESSRGSGPYCFRIHGQVQNSVRGWHSNDGQKNSSDNHINSIHQTRIATQRSKPPQNETNEVFPNSRLKCSWTPGPLPRYDPVGYHLQKCMVSGNQSKKRKEG